MPAEYTPVWHRRWFGLALATLVILLIAMFLVPPLLALLYAVRSVLVPVMLGLALAYIVNPLVTVMHQRLKLPRPLAAISLILAICLIVLGLIAYLLPLLIDQAKDLILSLPGYTQQVTQRLRDVSQQAPQWLRSTLDNSPGSPGSPATEAATSATNLDLMSISKWLFDTLDIGARAVTGAFGLVSYFALAGIIMLFCFFFFVWKFQAVVEWFVPFIPHSYRARTLEIIGMMDKSVAAFIRGRLIQAAAVAVVLSVGWMLAGVPYWLLLGIAGGILNLIPYAAVVAWPIAVLLTYLNWLSAGQTGGAGDFSYMAILIWPTIVYFTAQLLDGWVVEPLVQGKATDLDPLTVLLVVLIGGSLLGLLGMLIAIPTAACVKILAREIILPKLRQLAAKQPAI